MKNRMKISGIGLGILLLLISCSVLVQAQDNAMTVKKITSREYPQWFKEARLGIFIHWGLYSVPSWSGKEQYAEWFLRGLQTHDTARVNFQKRVFGDKFTYRDYPEQFKAELFNAGEWADIFRRSGARYVVLVSKHHDGYCLWPSEYAKGWNSVETGPHRDIVGELTTAVRKTGLKMGLYYSLPEWNNPLHRWYTDDHRAIGKYVDEHMVPQFKELVSKYRPSLIFADGEWFNSAAEWRSAELISWYYDKVGDEAIVNNRWGSGLNIGFLTPEYSSGIDAGDRPWAEVRGLGRSFGLNRNEKLEAYMTPEELVHFFVDAVANGGGIIINVGPGADGQIPLLQQERLLQLGAWLKVNGESVYGTQKWQKTHEERQFIVNRVDSIVNFEWVRNAPAEGIREDNFTAEWNGYIAVPESGRWFFNAPADDGVRVWIDGKLVVDRWLKSAGDTDSNVMTGGEKKDGTGDIKLKSGKRYRLEVEYFEGEHNASVALQWSQKNDVFEPVPSSALYLKADGDDHGLKAQYSSLKTWLCYSAQGDDVYATILSWPGASVTLPVHHVPDHMKVSVLGCEKVIPWKSVDEGIVLDLSHIYPNDLKGKYAWVFKLSGLNKK